MTGWQIFFFTLIVAALLLLFVRLMYRVYRLEQIFREVRDRLSEQIYE